jgi:hypothetical protein
MGTGMTTTDPFSGIPDASAEYKGTALATTAERAASEAPRCDKALDTRSEVCPRCFRQHAWLLEG